MSGPGTMEDALGANADPSWLLDDDGFDPLRETSRESRFAISNGFLGIRGARTINRGVHSTRPPRTYVAGLFDAFGAEQPIPGLVTGADWLQVRISLSGGPLAGPPLEMSSHHRTLDMSRGALLTGCRLSIEQLAGMRLRTLRLVSLSERAIGLQLLHMQIDEGEVEITLEASFEGVDLGLIPERLNQDLGVWRTHGSGRGLAMGTASSLQIDGQDLAPTALGPLKWSWAWTSRPGQVVRFERSVGVARSDTRDVDPGNVARENSTLRDGSAGAAWSRITRRPGQAAGSAAPSRSMATRPRNRHCGSPSTI